MDSSPLDLPQELVDTVIDYVQDCRTTIRSCSLVARIWLPRSRVHLFKNIKIQPTDQEREFRDVEQFRTRLMSLCTETSSSDLYPPLRDITEVLTIDTSRLSSSALLNDLFVCLPFAGLKTLHILTDAQHSFQRNALLHLLGNNFQLSSLDLNGVLLRDIFDLLELFVDVTARIHLRSLSMNSLHVIHRPDISKAKGALENFVQCLPLNPRRCSCLEILELGFVAGMPDLLTAPLFTHPKSLFDLSSLHTLHIQSFGLLSTYEELLGTCGQSIETMRLYLAPHNMTFLEKDWLCLTNLVSLEFVISFHHSLESVLDSLTLLIDRSFPLLPHLEYFSFTFHVPFMRSSYDFSLPFWNDVSTKLDPIFAGLPTKGASLEEITINVTKDNNPGIDNLVGFFPQTVLTDIVLCIRFVDHQDFP